MQQRTRLEFSWSFAAIAAGLAILLVAVVATFLLSIMQRDVNAFTRSARDRQNQVYELNILLLDAETGQRGFLLTGSLAYLEPYQGTRHQALTLIDSLVAASVGDAGVTAEIGKLKGLAAEKFTEMQRSLDLHAANNNAAVLELIESDRGKALMDSIRIEVATLRELLEKLVVKGRSHSQRLGDIRDATLVGAAVGILLFGAFAMIDSRHRLRAMWKIKDDLAIEGQGRKLAETQVRQLQKMEAVGQLTGGIAHDFNNMLGIVIGSLEVAKRRLAGSAGDGAVVLIDNALDGANRAAVLTARLLAFSRRQPLCPESVDINALVGGMSEMIRRTIGEDLRVEFVLGGGVWRVFVDPAQLEGSLLNLAVNARDAMPNGGSLTIETNNSHLDDIYADGHEDVKAGQYVMLSVSDTGTGMPADVVERAFEPFFTTKPAGRGTGLGLSQVFGFVKQTEGHVKIYSEPGRGTTVKIYLPRYLGNEEKAKVASKPAVVARSDGELILFVEDEEGLRKITAQTLRELGYKVIDTGSPLEALEQIKSREDIALLFTDVVMPEMTGRQLADEAAAIRPALPVLYTTGYTRNAIVHNGMVDPGVEFLQKPFSIEQLATKVRRILDARIS